MKRYSQIRLSIFLCIMMVLPSIVSVLPMTAQEVSAAQNLYVDWSYDISKHEKSSIEIEQGAIFNVGDYAYITDGNLSGTASLFAKAKYTSGKKDVASVNSKGLLTAKNIGISTIKIKYKGKTISAKFKVVEKGSLSNGDAAKGLQEAINTMSASIPPKITKANALISLQAKNNYTSASKNFSKEISNTGFLYEEVKDGNYTYTTLSNKLAVPNAGRYLYFDNLLYQYAAKNSPTSTRGSKALKISSVSANTKQITIKTKKAVTAENILATNIEYSSYNPTPNKTSATAYIYVYDKTTGDTYVGLATLKKGSKVLNIKLNKSEWVNGVYTTKTVKLKKGHTYVIGAKNLAWGNGKTVKVK